MSDQFDRDIDRVVRDHVAELQQEVIRLNDENDARRERWEALQEWVDKHPFAFGGATSRKMKKLEAQR